jgi:hypothetical protein
LENYFEIETFSFAEFIWKIEIRIPVEANSSAYGRSARWLNERSIRKYTEIMKVDLINKKLSNFTLKENMNSSFQVKILIELNCKICSANHSLKIKFRGELCLYKREKAICQQPQKMMSAKNAKQQKKTKKVILSLLF